MVRFEDSDDFLLSAELHRWGAYVVETAQRGIAGPALVRLVRRRSVAPVLLLSARPQADFLAGLEAGADMVWALDASQAHLAAALSALERRCGTLLSPQRAWRLSLSQGLLFAPDGTPIPLTDMDRVILQACADAPDRRIAREVLLQRLWGDISGSADMNNALHATVYRLRKRIENGGQLLSPLQAVPRMGYEFRAPLEHVRGSSMLDG